MSVVGIFVDLMVSFSLYQSRLTRMQYHIPLGQKIRTLLKGSDLFLIEYREFFTYPS